MINTDQDEPDDNPRREKDGDAAMQEVIHAIPETMQPRVNEGRVQNTSHQVWQRQRIWHFIVQELCESRGGPSWAVRPNEPSGFRGCKDLLNRASALVTTCP